MTRDDHPSGAVWTIDRLVPGGDGLARCADGRIGFASGVAPGDRIAPLRVEEHKSYYRALEWSLVEAGPARRRPPCKLAERCGGCDWMHLEYDEQLAQKGRLIVDALSRIGRLTDIPEPIEVVPSPRTERYRSRARFHVSAEGQLGFFAPSTHEVVPVDSCLVCDERIDHALQLVRERIPSSALTDVETLEIRVTPGDPAAVLHVWPRNRPDSRVQALWESLQPDHHVVVEDKGRTQALRASKLADRPTEHVEPVHAAGVFSQINPSVNERLIEAVVAGALARKARRFCDLYAGAGNFALPLAEAGLTGVGVESAAGAVDLAGVAVRQRGLDDRLQFVAANARDEVSRLVRRGEHFDLVVVDPPRAGARGTVEHIARLRPQSVAFCSCDPPTLARDLAVLVRAGYRLVSVTGFDMFPQTHHVEVLAWLEL